MNYREYPLLQHTLNGDEWQAVRDAVADDMKDEDGIRTAFNQLLDGQMLEFAHFMRDLVNAPSSMHESHAISEIRRLLEASLTNWRADEARSKKRLDAIHARMQSCEADY